MILDDLLDELVELNELLSVRDISFLLGGGMGLYVRDRFHINPSRGTGSYPIAIDSRTTKDLDIFLSGEVIIDEKRMSGLRDVLIARGYAARPGREYWQFERSIGDPHRVLSLDLLAPPPRHEDKAKVKITPPRIRPKAVKGIHGHLIAEAEGIEEESVPITILSGRGASTRILIPSSFRYLILKLHVFADRCRDIEKASHHALDIVRIVTDMTSDDWVSARRQYERERMTPWVLKAREIRREHFSAPDDLGITTVTKSDPFTADRGRLMGYIPEILQDLRNLLPD